MSPLEKWESIHGVDNLYQPKVKFQKLTGLKYVIFLLVGYFAGYMTHMLLIRGVF